LSNNPKPGQPAGPQSSDNNSEGFLSFDALMKESVAPESETQTIVESPFKAQEDNRIARKHSDIIIDQAKQEAVRLKEEAVQQGIDKGKEQVKQDTAQLMQQYAAVLAEIQVQRAALQQSYEQDIISLVKVMVEQLTNYEVTVSDQIIQTCLKKAMEFVVSQSKVRVRLNSQDFQRIRTAGLEDPAFLEGKSQVNLIEDPSISMGGCFLESSFGEIDATLENRRDQLYLAIDQTFREQQAKERGE